MTNTVRYTIDRVLSEIFFDQRSSKYVTYADSISSKSEINQWYLIAFPFQNMIPTKTRYKTLNEEFLAIIQAFKNWRYNLDSCKYKILIITNYITFGNS